MFFFKYIRALLLDSTTSLGLKGEDGLLELHQLAPQGVLLSQDAGDYSLGLVSGQVSLQAWMEFIFIQH